MYRIPLTCLLALLAAPAGAQDGLTVALDAAPGLRSAGNSLRFGPGDLHMNLSVAEPGTALVRARVLGDYYLTGPGFGGEQVSGGLRVTSGLAIGPRDGTTALPPSRLGGGLQWEAREPATDLFQSQGARVALPYIGLGYTSLSAREGWGLSADIGLGGQRPGERVRFGAGNPTAAQFENMLNDLRLAPVIQLGVSYAF
ncbi:MAG: hypothetical protein KBF65_02870 [Rubrivivax sp.]|jgi:hypothetical protein|nr:hypothetical protein [Betaproteobacteria bacterium]MBP6320305.1 hypothetical protein [Rubrivivax sp.]MBK7276365.1 hypothetical protein [Betaproteobacteria bacterium]MBK7460367.1 hypothetical protein [Betaproteobacteria bacterium]MBK7516290.1 hypothetical protein [Betaproteobacteria bacterium]